MDRFRSQHVCDRLRLRLSLLPLEEQQAVMQYRTLPEANTPSFRDFQINLNI